MSSWFDENSNDPEITRFAGNDYASSQAGYDPYHDPTTFAGYNPTGNTPTPNQQGGYSTAPPIDTATGTYPAGWTRGGDGLWHFSEPGANTTPPPTFAPTIDTRSSPDNYPRPAVPDLGNFRSPDPLRPWNETFTAPTAEEATSSPGFQFRLGEGLKALERSAAAKGTLLTGGTLKGEQRYAQGAASQEYKDVYGRAYNEYDTRRTNFLQNEANRYNSQRSNLTDQWGFNTDVFGMNNTNRMNDWGIASDYFNQGQAQRKTDFDIWNTQDTNAFDKIYRIAALKKPPSPFSLGY